MRQTPGYLVSRALPGVIYKYFEKPEYADSWCRGSFYLNTLDEWRKFEDAEKGDAGEATHRVTIDGVGCAGDAVMEQMRPYGIHFNGGDGQVINNTYERTLGNAWGFSFTDCVNPDIAANESIGKTCVQISNPSEFARMLTWSIASAIRPDALLACEMGYVTYAERTHKHVDPAPGKHGFVKPRDPYEKQREVRMLWHPKEWRGIKPIIVESRGARQFCRRL